MHQSPDSLEKKWRVRLNPDGVFREIDDKLIISEKSRHNLRHQREHLKDGTLCIAFNHLTLGDPFDIGELTAREFRGVAQEFLIPIGAYHYRKYLRKGGSQATLLKRAHWLGVNMRPLPQPYYTPVTNGEGNVVLLAEYERGTTVDGETVLLPSDEDAIFTQAQLFGMTREFNRTADEKMKIPGTVCLIAPEGHRTESLLGSMIPVQRGFIRIGRNAYNLAYAPMALIPQGEYDRNLGYTQAELVVAPPKSLPDLMEEWKMKTGLTDTKPTDVVGYAIASLLPEPMRGYYANPLG